MEHLTVDEMIRFVSLTELNSEAEDLIASVNRHIRGCRECLQRVRAFQTIYEEFTQLYVDGDFRAYAPEQKLEHRLEQEKHYR